MTIINLKDMDFEGREKIVNEIDALLNENIYGNDLAKIHLACAMLGDEKRYTQVLSKLNEFIWGQNAVSAQALGKQNVHQAQFSEQMKTGEHEGMKACICGYILVAAKHMENIIPKSENDRIRRLITSTLMEILSDKKITVNEFTAWAWGMVASAGDIVTYGMAKTQMEMRAENLLDKYVKSPSSVTRSNALQAYVLCMQAAAQAHDMQNFDNSIMQINHINHYMEYGCFRGGAMPDRLAQLWRVFSEEDTIHAWTFANIRLSAATMSYSDLFDAFEKPFEVAIASTSKKSASVTANILLARVTNQLALARIAEKLQCNSTDTNNNNKANNLVRNGLFLSNGKEEADGKINLQNTANF